VRGKGKSVRKSGQQQAGSGNFREVFPATGFTELSFKMDFQLAQKTAANGTGSHDRAPNSKRQAGAVVRSKSFQRILSSLPGSGDGPGSGAA